jgi:alkylation response protein AidB-like acyl-CoA dehydrogenase
MPTRVEATLMESVQAIAPVIRAHAEEAERAGYLSAETVAAMREARLFRMFVPKSLGGLEVDPITCARVIEAVAAVDSVAGWALSNPLSYSFWCSRLPDEGATEILGNNPDAIIAGPFHPPLRAMAVDGGYRITGRAPLASNCREATWIAATAMIMEGDAPRKHADDAPEVRMIFLRPEDCEILNTWSALGMRGSGSNDIKVDNAFVLSARTLLMAADAPRGTHYQGPLYRFPVIGLVCIAIPPITFALARGAIDEIKALAQEKTPMGPKRFLREKPFAQARVAQAEAALRSARALLYQTLEEIWQQMRSEERFTIDRKADLLLAATNAAQSLASAVELMYSVAGATAIYTRSPLERYFRDMEVLKQHGFTSQSRWETVGQVYLGLPPDLPVVAL